MGVRVPDVTRDLEYSLQVESEGKMTGLSPAEIVAMQERLAAAERERDELRKQRPDVGHAYLSTACYHQLHEQCRKECKFCPAKCCCKCHEEVPRG